MKIRIIPVVNGWEVVATDTNGKIVERSSFLTYKGAESYSKKLRIIL